MITKNTLLFYSLYPVRTAYNFSNIPLKNFLMKNVTQIIYSNLHVTSKKQAINQIVPPIPPRKKKEKKKDKTISSRLEVTKNIHYEIK